MEGILDEKQYINEQFELGGPAASSWLEGWITGYTDGKPDSVRQELMDHLASLKTGVRELNSVNDLIQHLKDLGGSRQLIVNVEGNTFPATTKDFVLWDPSLDTEHNEASPVEIHVSNWIE